MSLPEGGGGAFALPSPTHAHHMDVTSAVRSLRRSISRSPSRFLSRSNSRSSDGSIPASPQSPCRRLRLTPQRQQDQLSLTASSQSAPPAAASLAPGSSGPQASSFTPVRSNTKLSLRSAKSTRTLSPSRQLVRAARASPKSPLRRALNAASDQGNAAAAQQSYALFAATGISVGQENRKNTPSPASTQRRSGDNPARHSLHLDVSGSSESAFLKALDVKDPANSTSGALKRNDAMMNLDQPYQGSPVPKRRSMYGASSLDPNGDRGIFNSNQATPAGNFRIHEDFGNAPADATRIDSLDLQRDAQTATPTPSLPKRSSSLRKSTVMPRFSDRGSWGRRSGQRQLAQIDPEIMATPAKPRASVASSHFEPLVGDSPFVSTTPAGNPTSQFAEPRIPSNHHPLAQIQTLSASSSGSSFSEETSVFAPPPLPPTHRLNPHPFSQSLPLGAERPTLGSSVVGQATPRQQSVLFQRAYASTGLVSKVNRNPENQEKKLVPPDTPCKPWKKPSERFNTYPTAGTPASAKKSRTNNRNSFAGISSSIFQPPHNQTQGAAKFEISALVGGQTPSRSLRGSEFLRRSQNISNNKLFEDNNYEAVSTSGNVPPTPTKNGLTPSFSNLSEVSEQSSDQSVESPSMNRKSFGPQESFRPTPLRQPNFGPVSPLSERQTPRTPLESSLPESTGQLSISRQNATGISPNDNATLPPATPTTERDFRSSTGAFSTPIHDKSKASVGDSVVEHNLQQSFDEVTNIGDGEFSIVYRVKEKPRFQLSSVSPAPGIFSAVPQNTQGSVFVVKKSKLPYIGPRDRERKLREANILRSLRDAEHVVQYVADWEMSDHLYIQTEYCENGSLKDFYTREGFFGRLDDFCIFKIILDLTLGLQEIHNAGFMHLDMKPANVFVTFEGALKIGDFGLARSCSDAGSLDMEGDREYMAPEMLHGRFGQSSDIFSLGIMAFEAIANVEIPGNGEDWHKLRSGDFSGVPSLAWTASCETNPYRSGLHSEEQGFERTHDAGDLFGSHKRSELLEPPAFMEDATHAESLRSMISWMMSSNSHDRPTAAQLLSLSSLQWVAQRRKAPATIFEGRWGPVESEFPPMDVEIMDTEMTGV